MGWRFQILLSFCVIYCSSLSAQRVYYCEPYTDRFTLREELLGKVGEYYWVSSTTRKRVPRRNANTFSAEERTLTVYNTRMKLVNLIGEMSYSGEPIKEYLVTTYDHFDQVHLLKTNNKQVEVWLQRWEPDGQPTEEGRSVGLFPFDEPGNSFMLIRSEDRSRILL